MTPEIKREIDALRLSNQLDPKKFLRGGAKKDKVGEFFQVSVAFFSFLVDSVGEVPLPFFLEEERKAAAVNGVRGTLPPPIYVGETSLTTFSS
jgi:hypothetical protein